MVLKQHLVLKHKTNEHEGDGQCMGIGITQLLTVHFQSYTWYPCISHGHELDKQTMGTRQAIAGVYSLQKCNIDAGTTLYLYSKVALQQMLHPGSSLNPKRLLGLLTVT